MTSTLKLPDRVVLAFSVAVLVFGITFGVLARSAGMSPAQAIVMSGFVFAGAAQFAVVAALSAGGSAWVALVAGALLNLRLFALALAISPGLAQRLPLRALQSYLVSDESVAVGTRPDGSIDRSRFLQAGVWLLGAWVVGTTAGAYGGALVTDPLAWGFDAAFPGGFIALLAPRLREDALARWVALAGAVSCLALTPFVPLGVAPLVASLAALMAVRR